MTKLLALLKDGRARSVELLAQELHTSPEDIKRQMEYLERMGYLRRVVACGQDCKGCAGNCGSAGSLSDAPVFWEIVPVSSK